eukprot:12478324-Ditylum_brightwellii.AAC.1
MCVDVGNGISIAGVIGKEGWWTTCLGCTWVFLAVYNEEGCPGGGDTGGVLPSKKECNEKTNDFLIGDGCAILVLDIHGDGGKDSAIGMILVGVIMAFLDDLGEELNYFHVCNVVLLVCLCGYIGEEYSEGSQHMV